MNERDDLPVYVFRGEDGSSGRYTLFVERPAPPQRGGCISTFFGLVLIFILFFVLLPTVASQEANQSSVLSWTSSTPLEGIAQLQPTTSVSSATPSQPVVESVQPTPEAQARELINQLGAARNAALTDGDLGKLDTIAANPLLAFERDYALRMQAAGLRELWQLRDLQLHAAVIDGPTPSICATETWSIAITNASGVTEPAYQQVFHVQYTLERRASQLLIASVAYLDQPCTQL